MFRISKRFMFDGTKTFLREIKVPNTGSVARDHLANERTFLAWLRTSLALCGAGLALEALEFDTSHEYQDDQEDIFSSIPMFLNSRKKHIAALTSVSLGGCFMSYGTVRYFQVLKLLHKGHFVPNVYGILLSVSTFVIIGTGCVYFITTERHEWESGRKKIDNQKQTS